MQSSDFGSLTTPGYAAGGLAQTSEATNRPRNPVLGGLADLVGKVRGALNVEPHTLTTLGGTTLNTPAVGFGDFLTGHSPELLNDLAHGSQMFTQGPSNGRPYIPELLPQRKQQVADLVNLGLNLQPLAHPTTAASKMGAKALTAMTKDFVNSMADAGTIPARTLAQSGAIRPKGGNWGSVNLDNELSRLGDRTRPEVQAWRDNQLNRYIKTYLGTAEDPLLKLEKEGKLHLTPDQLNEAVGIKSPRTEIGEDPATGTNLYPLGDPVNGFPNGGNPFHKQATGRDFRTAWENLADDTVYQSPIQNQIDQAKRLNNNPQGSALPEQYSWLKKQDPTTQLLDASSTRSLGFDHVLDFLHQSDLTPEQLKHVSVPDAVRMTSDWNTRMARQQADQEAEALAAGTKLHKEYPDGMKWVQIGGHTAEDGLPPGYRIEQNKNTGLHDLHDDQTGEHRGTYADPDSAAQAAWKGQVEAGLNAEGKAMGHCVGGYCDDVAQGTKIYSLRDKNGQPHVTIEATPGQDIEADSIQQIKGKQNAAPVAKYLPYVQDFVKSGQWDQVNDLHNTGLLSHGDRSTTWVGDKNLKFPDQPYYTPKELTDHFIDQGADPTAAYTKAGYHEPLNDPAHPDALANRFPDYQPPDQ